MAKQRMSNSSNEQKAEQLAFDIRRSILLASYLQHWGQPLNRSISMKEGSLLGVEVYEFPAQNDGVHRFATIGVSCQTLDSGSSANWELLFCLPPGLGGADATSVVDYQLDIMAYSLRAEVDMKVGTLIPVSTLAPNAWTTKALLVDEARGEAEEMYFHSIGRKRVELLWLVPLTGSEYDLVKSKGVDAFDRLEAESHVSLLDVNRDGMG